MNLLSRLLQATSQMVEGSPPAVVVPAGPITRKRKRSVDACSDPLSVSNKRRSFRTSEVPLALPAPEVLPNPDQEWGDHLWRSNVVSKLVAASTEMIALVPQGSSRKFFVHKELLCYYSPTYRSIFNDQGCEEKCFVVKTTQSALALFTKWLYTRDLTPSDSIASANLGTDLMDLYLFATATLILSLRRDIMTAVQGTHHSWFLDYAMLEHMYRFLPSDSPVLKFIVSTHVHHWTPECDNEDVRRVRASYAPAEFLFAVIEGQAGRIRRMRETQDDSLFAREASCCGDICEFHEHESEEERAATCGVEYEPSERPDIDGSDPDDDAEEND